MNELESKQSKPWLRYLACLALLAALLIFALRGPYQSTQRHGDFSVIYAAARTWLLGGNPYDYEQINETLNRAGAPDEHRPAADSLQSVYPPPTYVTVLDISLLPWSWARPAMTILNCVFSFAIVYLLIDLARLKWPDAAAIFLAAFIIGFGPLHTTIWLGQLTIVALACLILAICFEHRERVVAAGIFFGLAASVKVHFGLPFIAYYLFRKRWTTAGMALLTFVILTILAVIRLKIAGIDWLPALRDNIQTMTSAGNNADPTLANPLRYQLINLQYLLHTFLDNKLLVTAITLGFVGAAAFTTIYLIRGNRDPRRELAALAMVGTLDLLITYHRYYDAAMLTLAIAYAFTALAARQRLQGILILILAAVFMVPSSIIVHQLGGRLPEQLTTSALWEVIIQPHQVWALLAMVAVLLWTLTGTAGKVGNAGQKAYDGKL